MPFLKAAIISLLVVGCNEQTKADNGPKLSVTAQRIEYVIDERTGLCFVDNTVNDGYNGLGVSHIYTNVPCYAEVQKLVKK